MTVTPRRGSLRFEKFISLVLQRNYEEIKVAISADDFEVNKEDFRGVTVLHYAAELGDVELIQMILKHHPKANINAKTLEMMSTPLMIAAGSGKVEAVELLLEHGADAECQNAIGYTALMIAVEQNNVECVDALLNSGRKCNISAQNIKGHNALMLALSSLELTEILIGHSDINEVDGIGRNILHLAVHRDNIDVLNLILTQPGISIDAHDSSGATPLDIAIREKKMNLADILIEKGANIFDRGNMGLNAFHFAAIYDDKEEFIKKYENLYPEGDIKDLFEVLARNNRLNTIKRLISKADEDCICEGLFRASANGHLECVKYLFEQLKNPDEILMLESGIAALSDNNYDCFQFFYEKLLKNENVAETFLKTNERLIISAAFLSGCFEACKFLLNQGIDPNGTDPETLLMVASGNGFFEIVELLIEHGADVNRVHEKLGSALLLATINQHDAVVDLLLKNGADPSISDESGFTPLLSAAYYGYEEIFLKIFEFDKNVKQRTKDGLTPLLAACRSGCREIIQCLLKYGSDIKEEDYLRNNCMHCAALEDAKTFESMLQLARFIHNDSEILGSLLSSRNSEGKTPLELIISHQDQKLIYSLIANEPAISKYFVPINEFVIETVGNNDMCLICRDDFELEDVATKLPCGHLFHKYCYEEWSVTKPNCPYCQIFPFKLK